ncbi:MAG: hypothetical protein ACFUZC_23400 [Chthoniobacteraceae bacterium]
MNSQDLQLPGEQVEVLERIARENQTAPETLLLLAVTALIEEARRNEGWLDAVRPKNPRS